MRKQHAIPPMILILMISFAAILVYSLLAPVLFPVDLGETDIMNRLKPPAFAEGGDEEDGHRDRAFPPRDDRRFPQPSFPIGKPFKNDPGNSDIYAIPLMGFER